MAERPLAEQLAPRSPPLQPAAERPQRALPPAYYASERTGRARDWWALLHPPYTAWHLAYVVIGASLVPHERLVNLLASIAAFFLAVGIGAHALDELHGRPLRTGIGDRTLAVVAALSLAGASALGVAGVIRVGWVLAPFIVVGVALVLCYNLELFGGRLHRDASFALGWGSFPVLVGCVAQAGTLEPAAVLAAVAAFALSYAQRVLSTRARQVRRSAAQVGGTLVLRDGTRTRIDPAYLLAPVELALRALSWTAVLLAASLAVARMA